MLFRIVGRRGMFIRILSIRWWWNWCCGSKIIYLKTDRRLSNFETNFREAFLSSWSVPHPRVVTVQVRKKRCKYRVGIILGYN